jgi:hypothetical protein
VADLTSGPPSGALSCAYKDHLVLARSAANKNRVWFSDGADYTGWNTAAAGQWLDTTYPIQGLAALRNMIIVFGEGHTERIRGNIIPGVDGGDMVVEPLFSIGCSDPASVAVTDDYVVFANSAGVYLTDGVGVANLTLQGGIDQLWRTTLASYSSAYTIAGAVFRDKYHVVVMNDSTFVGAFVCDVKRRIWTQLTNVKCPMMVSTPLGIIDSPPALYGADRSSKFVMDLSTMYTPSSTVKADGDGTAVTWTLETAHFMGKAGKKRWKALYPRFYMSDAASDNPTIAITASKDPSLSTYPITLSSLSENTATERKRIRMGFSSEGVQLKFAQSNASADTRILSIEADAHPMEQSRL